MKIAISGKGGVGKTTVSGSLCRLIGKRGMRVLAIEGDPNPNLAVVLGLANQEPSPLSTELLERIEEEDGSRRVQLKKPLEEVVESHGVAAPDNVQLVMLGKPDHAGTGCMCGSHAVIREVVHSAVSDSDYVTVLDMEASLEHMKRGTSRYVDFLFVVVEPYYRSLEAARRIAHLATELGIQKVAVVANKVRTEEDEQAIREYCEKVELPIVAVIPFDEQILAAERQGMTIVDLDGESPALRELEGLADHVLSLEGK